MISAEERARLRVLCEGVDTRWARDMLALLGALDAADKQWALMADAADAHATRAERAEADLAQSESTLAGLRRVHAETVERYQRVEADLADEKRRHAGLRAGVEALADELECPPHYRDTPEALAWHIQNCHGCEKGGRVRALLSDTTTGGE